MTLRISERASNGSWQPARTITLDGIAEWSESYLAEWSTGEGLLGGYVAEATVFGGGVTGLAAAHELVDCGFAVTVVEPEEALDAKGVRGMAIGGMARSHYARVPRVGQAPANRPAGRPTPSARDNRWGSRKVVFLADSSEVPDGARDAIAGAARAFRDTYCYQGYRMRVIGAAASRRTRAARRSAPAAQRPSATSSSRAGSPTACQSCLPRTERAGIPRPCRITLEDHVLPGEHGFRFFPAYYRHVTDTMARIPVYDCEGHQTERR